MLAKQWFTGNADSNGMQGHSKHPMCPWGQVSELRGGTLFSRCFQALRQHVFAMGLPPAVRNSPFSRPIASVRSARFLQLHCHLGRGDGLDQDPPEGSPG